MGINICYLELIFILLNFYQQQKLILKGHTDRDLSFEEKRQKALEKILVVNLVELIQVMQKMVMIQIMRLVMYKHLLMSSKIKK